MKGFNRWARSSTTIDEGLKSCFSKAAYSTESLAKEVIGRRMDNVNHTLRYYKCEICSAFHLTKKLGVQATYTEVRDPNQTELERYIQRHKQLLLDL
jgi:hypothetical protein